MDEEYCLALYGLGPAGDSGGIAHESAIDFAVVGRSVSKVPLRLACLVAGLPAGVGAEERVHQWRVEAVVGREAPVLVVHDVQVCRAQVRRMDRARVRKEDAQRRQVSEHVDLDEEQGTSGPPCESSSHTSTSELLTMYTYPLFLWWWPWV